MVDYFSRLEFCCFYFPSPNSCFNLNIHVLKTESALAKGQQLHFNVNQLERVRSSKRIHTYTHAAEVISLFLGFVTYGSEEKYITNIQLNSFDALSNVCDIICSVFYLVFAFI